MGGEYTWGLKALGGVLMYLESSDTVEIGVFVPVSHFWVGMIVCLYIYLFTHCTSALTAAMMHLICIPVI